MSGFTANEVIEVYLKRWALAELGNSLIKVLRPRCMVIQKAREYEATFDLHVQRSYEK